VPLTRAGPAQAFAPEALRIARLAWPLAIGQFAIMGMGVTDVIFAGNAGTADLAAVTIGYYVWDLGMLLVFGIVLANSALVGHCYGAGDRAGIRRQFQQCLWLSLPLALVAGASIVVAILAVPHLGLEPAVAEIAIGYLVPTIVTSMLVPIAITFRTTAEGVGLARPVMWIMLAGFLCNIPLNYALVFGAFGLPRMGGAGCGWATLISFTGLLIAWIVYSLRGPVFGSYRLWQDFTAPRWREIRATLALGLPIGLSLMAVGGFFAVVPLAMVELGTLAIAGHAVAITFDSVMITVPLGLGQAMSVRVAHELGGGNPAGARRVCATGMALVLGIAALQATLTVLAREPIASLFSQDPAVRELGAVLLVYAAAYRIFDSMQIGAGMALRGYQDTRVSSAIDVTAYWVFGLPLCYSLGLGSRWNEAYGVQGFWTGMVIAIGAAACCIALRLVLTSARAVRVALSEASA
jgi:MATE family multidrug resistance protein